MVKHDIDILAVSACDNPTCHDIPQSLPVTIKHSIIDILPSLPVMVKHDINILAVSACDNPTCHDIPQSLPVTIKHSIIDILPSLAVTI